MVKTDDIRKIKKSVEEELLKKPGVKAVEVGYKIVKGKKTNELAIRVHVTKKKKDVPHDQMIPSTIEGVKTDVIERTYVPQPVKVSLQQLKLQADTRTYTPLVGGISIGPCRSVGGFVFAGTLGVIVSDNTSDAPMMLSNFHVMAINNGWTAGDTISQPSLVDGGSCPSDKVGKLKKAILNGSVDCAIASVDNTRDTACEITEIGSVAGTVTAELDMPVQKRGRTTGHTFGTVESIDQTVTVDYGGDVGSKTLTNQIGVAPDTSRNAMFSDHGDSGSVTVTEGVGILGLLFAGSSDGHSTLNPIQAVLENLNVSICSTQLNVEKLDSDTINIKAEAMNIKAEAMNIKAEAMNIKAEAMNIKALRR
jgi:hypothetical protein